MIIYTHLRCSYKLVHGVLLNEFQYFCNKTRQMDSYQMENFSQPNQLILKEARVFSYRFISKAYIKRLVQNAARVLLKPINNRRCVRLCSIVFKLTVVAANLVYDNNTVHKLQTLQKGIHNKNQYQKRFSPCP